MLLNLYKHSVHLHFSAMFPLCYSCVLSAVNRRASHLVCGSLDGLNSASSYIKECIKLKRMLNKNSQDWV